jgi:hypothetical protein
MLGTSTSALSGCGTRKNLMKEREPPRDYLSYLLRLWRSSDGKQDIWRTSLQRPGSDRREGFANLQELFDFLEIQTGSRDERGLDKASEEDHK